MYARPAPKVARTIPLVATASISTETRFRRSEITPKRRAPILALSRAGWPRLDIADGSRPARHLRAFFNRRMQHGNESRAVGCDQQLWQPAKQPSQLPGGRGPLPLAA